MSKLKLLEEKKAKPFLKWAGGKNQLIPELAKRLPLKIIELGKIDYYIEPFIGGGAFFFYLKNNYIINQAVLMDINQELVLAYKTVRDYPHQLIEKLAMLEKSYLKGTTNQRKEFFYKIRARYNMQQPGFNYDSFNFNWIIRTAYLIFLNKTCYNGLFRQNRKGGFNVPYGSYKNPNICNKANILEVQEALKDTEIICSDFENLEKYIRKGSFIYLDPPYRPLNGSSNFTSYSKESFSEEDQIRLAHLYKKMDQRDALLMLSNSDPKNENPEDDFFDKLYSHYNIERVLAKRSINCIGTKRGEIKELIIRNYS
ncbi:MAG: DNA adenine methylase [Actinomycetota bacterium]|nr:DNA adenine methylase [Actinomycetota bacterium]